MYLNEIEIFIARVGIEEERNKSVVTFLNMYSKHDLEIPAELVDERLGE